MKRALRIEATYNHPPAKVWRLLTSKEHIAKWLMESDFVPEVGRTFQFRSKPMGGWDGIVNGEVLEVVPERKIVYSWKSNKLLDTVVTFMLEPAGTGTRLTLLHTGFNGFGETMISYILGSGWGSMVRKRIPNLITQLEADGKL